MSLTRTDLESRRLQQMIAETGLDIPVLSEADLAASIEAILQQQAADSDLWIFAYGSLIWNPVFDYVDRQVGTVYGWHRQFCLWTPLGRGTPDNPGLVLGLDRGGCCRGIVYRIAAANVQSELLLVWRREMVVNSYVPRWVKVFNGDREIRAITFTINHQHPAYACKLPPPVIVHQIATASGALGSCADYLLQTVEGLESAGIRDRHLLQLRDRVLEMQQAAIAEQIHPDLSTYYQLNSIWTEKVG